jgi:glycosyltransferase involved in cell wall biosynthesis
MPTEDGAAAMRVSFAIPTYNRVENVVDLARRHADDARIGEIVVCDDASRPAVVAALRQGLAAFEKVRFETHPENLGAFANKRRTVAACRHPWVVLCDSDNTIERSYIDRLERASPWCERTLHCPSLAAPKFDFRRLAGRRVETVGNLREWLDDESGKVLLNAGNFFFGRERYLRASGAAELFGLLPQEVLASDVVVLNFLWIATGGAIECVEGLTYLHDHESRDSFWRKTRRRSKRVAEELRRRLDAALAAGN